MFASRYNASLPFRSSPFLLSSQTSSHELREHSVKLRSLLFRITQFLTPFHLLCVKHFINCSPVVTHLRSNDLFSRKNTNQLRISSPHSATVVTSQTTKRHPRTPNRFSLSLATEDTGDGAAISLLITEGNQFAFCCPKIGCVNMTIPPHTP